MSTLWPIPGFRSAARQTLLALSIVVIGLIVTLAPSAAPTAQRDKPLWAHLAGDVSPDPAVRYGILPNGMRYALMNNKLPPGAVSVRLIVGLGSLNESDAELGLSHFIEHMAFNGSKNVPEGEVVKSLERLGLSLGSEMNASTSQTDTVYSLDLPNNSQALIDQSLLLLREVVGELTFDSEAVERERRIVLAEYRRGATFEQRRRDQQLEFLLPGALAIARMPIGNPRTLETVGREALVSLYRRYYRPQRAILLIVGDIDVAVLASKIIGRFGDWSGQGEAGKDPDLSYAPRQRQPDASTFTQAEGGDSITVYSPAPFDELNDTVANRREGGLLALARGAMLRRFARLADSENPPFRSASMSYFGLLETVDVATATAAVRPGGWKNGLQALEREWRRALLYGFTESEIAEQVAVLRASKQAAAQGEISRTTEELVAQLLVAVRSDQVFSPPSSDLARFESWVSEATPELVQVVFRNRMKVDRPLFFLSTSIPQPNVETQIPAAWTESSGIAVAPLLAGNPVAEFAYTDFGPVGHVVRDQRLATIDTRIVTFANGVRLNMKKTAFQKNSVLVSLRVGEGALGLEQAPLGLVSLMGAYTAGGLEKHSVDELRSILSGRTVQGQFSISPDAFGGTYSNTPDDLQLQLQLAAAFMMHAGYRPEAERRWRENIVLSWPRLDANAQSVFASRGSRMLLSGDRRFGSDPDDGVIYRSFTELKDYIGPMLADGAVEIAIVGDIDEDDAIAAIAETFGALPGRKPNFLLHRSDRPVSFRAPGDPIVLGHTGEHDQAQVSLYWHVDIDPEVDPQAVRVLSVLASVMRLKITATVREELGVSYAPSASSTVSSTYPGLAYVVAGSEVKPEDADKVSLDFRAIAAQLRAGEISGDEFKRALAPSLEQLHLHASSNSYWLAVISEAQSRPDSVDRSKLSVVEAGLRAVTISDLVTAANRWLGDDKFVRATAMPIRHGPLNE